jgi:hypothetical protein
MARTARRTPAGQADALACWSAVLLLRVDPTFGLAHTELASHLAGLLSAVSQELEATASRYHGRCDAPRCSLPVTSCDGRRSPSRGGPATPTSRPSARSPAQIARRASPSAGPSGSGGWDDRPGPVHLPEPGIDGGTTDADRRAARLADRGDLRPATMTPRTLNVTGPHGIVDRRRGRRLPARGTVLLGAVDTLTAPALTDPAKARPAGRATSEEGGSDPRGAVHRGAAR